MSGWVEFVLKSTMFLGHCWRAILLSFLAAVVLALPSSREGWHHLSCFSTDFSARGQRCSSQARASQGRGGWWLGQRGALVLLAEQWIETRCKLGGTWEKSRRGWRGRQRPEHAQNTGHRPQAGFCLNGRGLKWDREVGLQGLLPRWLRDWRGIGLGVGD